MKGAPTSFWGKLERDPVTAEVTEWHPLAHHCADVAACAEALLALPTWRRRLARLSGREDLDDTTRDRLAVLAVLHDIGKFNLGFQAKGRPELGVTAGHMTEALGAIGHPALASVEPLGDWGEGTTGLLITAICHHGRPYSFRHSDLFVKALWSARSGLDPQKGVRELLDACRTWFPRAFADGGTDLPNDAGFEHAFAGLVMLADWLGSNKRFFRYTTTEDEGDRMAYARAAARDFMADSWLAIDEGRRSDRSKQNSFARIADEKMRPRPAQAAALELPSDDASSITIIECETGSGKTEAALARFVTLFSASAVDGMYFALPTRTAASEMYRRVHKAMQRAFSEPPPVVLAVPGYLRVDDVGGNKLPPFEVLWDTDRERFRYRSWAGEAPKRYLAGCVVVGTIDQVLLSSLRVGHAHLRATALLRQLLVVDEVHASDAYMTRILEDVLARHVKAGGHALLLSATLGGETRSRLLHPREHAPLPDFDEAVQTPYPLISHRGVSTLASAVASDAQSRVVALEAVPLMEDADSVAALVIDAALAGAKVLVIKNTVADCVRTQRSVEDVAARKGANHVLFKCRGVVSPHHARFARCDREALDEALTEHFGKKRSPDGCIVVATQTVQQSLDLDADFLLSDLCPMDVLLQRIGRLHRHSRHPGNAEGNPERSSGFASARAKVIVPAQRDLGLLLGEKGGARHYHGLGIVYPDLRILEATWRLVEEFPEWRIPEMNRTLVEHSIHSRALDAVSAQGGPRWQAHAQQVLGAVRGAARQAGLNIVDWTTPYSETTFPDDGRVPTRLGEGDRRVTFEQPFPSPFGHPVSELVVRAWWATGVPPDVAAATAVTSVGGITSFQFGVRKFVYDRHGLRLDKAAKEEALDDDGP